MCTELPLHAAARDGDAAKLEKLLTDGAKVDALDDDSEPALVWACMQGHKDAVRVLLQHGASIEKVDEEGTPPLIAAISKNHEALARSLLDQGAKLDSKEDDFGMSALHMSVSKGLHELALLFIKRGHDIDATSDNGETPLHVACKKNDTVALDFLLAHGATLDFDADPGSGCTPLCLAVELDRVDLATSLLDRGAQVNARVTYFAKIQGGAMYKLVAAHGADAKMVLPCGGSVLHMAACDGEVGVVNWCVREGADINLKDDEGMTALMLAAGVEEPEDGHQEVVQVLLKHKVDADIQDSNGDTALHHAARDQNEQAFEAIARAGGNMELENGKGRVPKLRDGKCVIC